MQYDNGNIYQNIFTAFMYGAKNSIKDRLNIIDKYFDHISYPQLLTTFEHVDTISIWDSSLSITK